MNISSNSRFVLVPVPVQFWTPTLKFLSELAIDDSESDIQIPYPISPEGSGSPSSPLLYNNWTTDEIAQLRLMINNNPTATALFELTCGNVGVRKGFQDACERAGKTVDKGRADLSGLTKLIRSTWGKNRGWPLNWAQEGTRIVYYASQALADAWHAAK